MKIDFDSMSDFGPKNNLESIGLLEPSRTENIVKSNRP